MKTKYRRGIDMVDKVRRFAGIGLLLLVIGATVMIPSVSATPTYASSTGKSCGTCHVSSAGGGPLTTFGKAFLANGHKIPTVTPKPVTPPVITPKPVQLPPVITPKPVQLPPVTPKTPVKKVKTPRNVHKNKYKHVHGHGLIGETEKESGED